jgi:hypothetical protein
MPRVGMLSQMLHVNALHTHACLSMYLFASAWRCCLRVTRQAKAAILLHAGNRHLELPHIFPRSCVVFYSSKYVENSFAFCYFTVGFFRVSLLFFWGWDRWDEPDSSLCVCVCSCAYEGIHGGLLLQFVSWKKMTDLAVLLLNALNVSQVRANVREDYHWHS